MSSERESSQCSSQSSLEGHFHQNGPAWSFPGVQPPAGYNPWMGGFAPLPVPWAAPWMPSHDFPKVKDATRLGHHGRDAITSPAWAGEHPNVDTVAAKPAGTAAVVRADDYTVDSLQRIYSNDDGSIEIERVKFQRRQPCQHEQAITVGGDPVPHTSLRLNANVHSHESLVPARTKRKKNIYDNPQLRNQPNMYPYITYLPYPPYPYPQCFGYFWPPTFPRESPEISVWQHTADADGSMERASSSPCCLPVTLASQKSDFEPSNMLLSTPSPVSQRSLSPASHGSNSHSSDLAPSSSVSIMGLTQDSSQRCDSTDSKTRDWILEMHRNLNRLETTSGDRSSFATAESNVPTPPLRKHKRSKVTAPSPRQPYGQLDKGNKSKTKPETRNSDLYGRNLNYAFKKFEKSVDLFKTQVSDDHGIKLKTTEGNILRTIENEVKETAVASISDDLHPQAVAEIPHLRNKPDSHPERNGSDNRDSRISSSTYHSVLSTMEDLEAELPATDTSERAADEAASRTPVRGSSGDYTWVLLQPGESPDFTQDEYSTVWLAEVSLWRARLVVSLTRGHGLDQDDWTTFRLLLHHPLPVQLKLSFLHATRLCAANSDIGAVQVRAALLQLTRHSQTLLLDPGERGVGWQLIHLDGTQSWTLVKGSKEILKILGYEYEQENLLQYSEKSTRLDSSHLARLSLDLLLLADELRLYLTGIHPQPTHITDLFCPPSSSAAPSPEPFFYQRDGKDMTSADSVNSDKFVTPRNSTKISSVASVHSDIDTPSNLTPRVERRAEALHANSIGMQNIQDTGTNLQSLTHRLSNQSVSYSGSENEMTLLEDGDHLKMKNDTVVTSFDSSQKLTKCAESAHIDEVITSQLEKPENKRTSTVPAENILCENGNEINCHRSTAEEHIYEEITENRTHKTKSRSDTPPPLPPKTRQAQVDDDRSIASSKSELSTISSTSSLIRARRKKRKAPMPPSFLQSNSEKERMESMKYNSVEINGLHLKNSSGLAVDKSLLPPLPNETSSPHQIKENALNFKSSPNKNPFYEESLVPSGYVGKNPFYEDVARAETRPATNTIYTQTPRNEPEYATHQISSSNTIESVEQHNKPAESNNWQGACTISMKQIYSKIPESSNIKEIPMENSCIKVSELVQTKYDKSSTNCMKINSCTHSEVVQNTIVVTAVSTASSFNVKPVIPTLQELSKRSTSNIKSVIPTLRELSKVSLQKNKLRSDDYSDKTGCNSLTLSTDGNNVANVSKQNTLTPDSSNNVTIKEFNCLRDPEDQTFSRDSMNTQINIYLNKDNDNSYLLKSNVRSNTNESDTKNVLQNSPQNETLKITNNYSLNIENGGVPEGANNTSSSGANNDATKAKIFNKSSDEYTCNSKKTETSSIPEPRSCFNLEEKHGNRKSETFHITEPPSGCNLLMDTSEHSNISQNSGNDAFNEIPYIDNNESKTTDINTECKDLTIERSQNSTKEIEKPWLELENFKQEFKNKLLDMAKVSVPEECPPLPMTSPPHSLPDSPPETPHASPPENPTTSQHGSQSYLARQDHEKTAIELHCTKTEFSGLHDSKITNDKIIEKPLSQSSPNVDETTDTLTFSKNTKTTIIVSNECISLPVREEASGMPSANDSISSTEKEKEPTKSAPTPTNRSKSQVVTLQDEERYEIPDAVRGEGTVACFKVDGKHITLTSASSPRASAYRPVKPPRRRRQIQPADVPHNHLNLPSSSPHCPPIPFSQSHQPHPHHLSSICPPLPPKKSSQEVVPPPVPRGRSSALSLKVSSRSSSKNTLQSLSTPSSPDHTKKSKLGAKAAKIGKSWPHLFCDCIYANCRNEKLDSN